MGFEVIWSPRALVSLEKIVSDIAQDNPVAAVAMGERLVERSLLLANFPQLGAVFSELGRPDVREMAAPPYRLIYRVQMELERVTVLVAWHGARQEPEFVALQLNDKRVAHDHRGPFTAIAAMSLNRVIGNGNKIPWHLPEDFKWFKAVTMGHVLVMGRKTFESIGRPLPGRETIVLSRGGWSHPAVKVAAGLEALPLSPEDSRAVFIAGGAEIYRQALPQCAELLLTLVKREVAGDAFFPAFEDEFELVEEIRDTPEFRILRYRRKRSGLAS